MDVPLPCNLPDGREAARFELRGAGGIRVLITNLGATLMRIDVPDRDGRLGNILLGHDDPAAYPTGGAPGPTNYLGATCGRYANRIHGASFELDGRIVRLEANEGAHHLHGGSAGFSHAIWRVEEASRSRLRLSHISPAGDAGWPGTLRAEALFSLSEHGVLEIEYLATTDAATAVNLVSHPYFNLSGDPAATILDHELQIMAQSFLPIDAEQLPTGERQAVAGSPFDFRRPRAIDSAIGQENDQLTLGAGYNHAFLPDGSGLRLAATLAHRASGRRVIIETDQPSIQFYSGNALSGAFSRHCGLCLETQALPDSVNHADFPSTWLRPGDTYRSRTRFHLGQGG